MRQSYDSQSLNMPPVLMIACMAFAHVTLFDRDEVHGQMMSRETAGTEGCRSADLAAPIGPMAPASASVAGSGSSSSEIMPQKKHDGPLLERSRER